LAILTACAMAGGAAAQPGPTPTGGVWTAAGERACDGRSWSDSYSSATPDPGLCTPTSDGMTAVCGGNQCRYRAVTPEQCRSEGTATKLYRCQAPAASREAAQQAVCSARRTVPWPAAGKDYSITAIVDGATCASASATVIVRRPDGVPIWSHTVATRRSLEFQHLATPKDLDAVLKSLLRIEDYVSDILPEWADGAPFPPRGWYAADQVTREQWNAVRAAKLPGPDLHLGHRNQPHLRARGDRWPPRSGRAHPDLIRASACVGGSA
jgi:hypothetical protein